MLGFVPLSSTPLGEYSTGTATARQPVVPDAVIGFGVDGFYNPGFDAIRTKTLEPTADVNTNWTTHTGASTSLYSGINENYTADDSDYIISPTVNSTTTSTQTFSLPTVAPGYTSSNYEVFYRVAKASNGGGQKLTVRLLQNTTQIASWSQTITSDTPATVRQFLTSAQVSSITDYSALRLEFIAGG